ncbi:Vi polysaccharide export inner membrane protein VexD [Phocoenobacter uteri]|uniref:Vi polysaccharide export inner membrane protein VexD n=1 Tax=Phocoenobacter uteri TaxID=146806 RepID=A0A379CC71_9PAST|nr:capsule biosynthesis protein [Phocoenobacter uteri]MDG6881301.1 capsule biosynthesis protein [Phocoenobacter uteri]SUB59325.1 Vi polysaccharide export inner membrane protein VexD [Phocoenobacter uteri]
MKKLKKLKKFLRKFSVLFYSIVVAPTFLAVIYFGIFASDVYISQSSFVVRSSTTNNSLSGFGALLQGVGFSRSQDDSYTLREYLYSRDALSQLQVTLPVKAFYEDKGDFLSKFNTFGLDNSKESFYQYFRKHINVNLDRTSGIATLSIHAFSPEDGVNINNELLRLGENLINKLNTRARNDALFFAKKNVKDAEERVKEVGKTLTNYRIKNNIFDLSAQSGEQFSLVSNLQVKLIDIQNQLAQLIAISPYNPQVSSLKLREKNIKNEITKQLSELYNENGSFVTQSSEYQRLILDNKLADQMLASAITSLQHTQNEIDRQQLYLEVINPPSKPDIALEPHRLYNIISTFFICLMLFGILKLIVASIREHKN